MKKILLVMVVSVFFLLGCTAEDGTLDLSNISDQDVARVSNEAVICNAPYLRVGIQCCLDANSNSICDRDEFNTTSNTTIEPPLIVCNAPYIRLGLGCCLDANANTICDSDESPPVNQTTCTLPSIRFGTGCCLDANNNAICDVDEQLVNATPNQSMFSRIPLGINLASIADWSTEIPFVDVFKTTREWITGDANGAGPWDTGLRNQLTFDQDGYPTEIPFTVPGSLPQKVRTILFTDTDGKHPVGNYTLLYEGDGDISFVGATIVSQTPGRMVVTIPSGNGVILSIDRSTRGNHVRNIRLIMPGHEQTYVQQPLNPAFVTQFRNLSVIRFMDLGQTNHNPLTSWSERPTPRYYTQSTPKGLALEHMIQIANTLEKDLWINIPHKADDTYIRNTAQMIRSELNSDRNVYVEYSNEVWNGIFSQTAYIQAQGCSTNATYVINQTADSGIVGCEDLMAGAKYQAKRSSELFTIFEQELGDARVTNVISSLIVNPWLADRVFESFDDGAINPTGVRPESYAVNPYFGASVGEQIIANGEVTSISVDEILNRAQTSVRGEIRTWIRDSYQVAQHYNVTLLAYEGGQHLTSVGNPALTAKFINANRHPRMYDLYVELLDTWYRNGGDTFMQFSSVVKPSQYGSWGAVEYLGQPVSEAPKYRALLYMSDQLRAGLYSSINVTVPVCGNGILETGEVCDATTQSCTLTSYSGTQSCNSVCTGYNACTTTQFCGDGIVNGNESCDDGNTNDGDTCSTACTIQTPPLVQNGLVAYWPFDASLSEASSSRVFTPRGSIDCTVPGIRNQACLIGNDAAVLSVPVYPLQQNEPAGFAGSVWVKFENNTGEKVIWSMAFENFGLKYFGKDWTGNARFDCIMRNSSQHFIINEQTNFLPQVNEWYHIVCSYDRADATLRMYVNGVQNETAPAQSFNYFPHLNTSGMSVGCQLPNFCTTPTPQFQVARVTVDELKFFNKSLTLQEAQTIYQNR